MYTINARHIVVLSSEDTLFETNKRVETTAEKIAVCFILAFFVQLKLVSKVHHKMDMNDSNYQSKYVLLDQIHLYPLVLILIQVDSFHHGGLDVQWLLYYLVLFVWRIYEELMGLTPTLNTYKKQKGHRLVHIGKKERN